MRHTTPQSIHRGQLSVLTLALSGALAAMTPVPGSAQQTISTPSTPLSWSSSDLTITGSGVVLSTGVTAAVATGGMVGTLYNSGSITGGRQGVNNVGNTINALINSGAISGNIFAGGIGVAGISNDSGTIQTLNNTVGGIITGITGISNTGSIASLSNSGNITGYYAIKVERGSIGTLTNDGTISGYINPSYLGNQGIEIISGSIGTLTNNNDIHGFYSGIHSLDGTVGTLTNNAGGTIRGQNFSAVEISGGTFDTLTNHGLISGTSGVNVNNSQTQGGTLNLLSNDGTITGTDSGIYNNGRLGTLSNLGGGVINGGTAGFGIQNDLSIGTLGNSGTIIGGTGIYNNGNSGGGTIGALGNSGTISGNLGVFNAGGTISSLNNSGLINSALGIFNQAAGSIGGTIGLLQNSGTINAGQNFTSAITGTISSAIFSGGIVNGSLSSIDTLTNTGLISSIFTIDNSGSGTIITGGIINTGSITTLNNSGVVKTGSSISGSNAGAYVSVAIYNAGTIGTFNNLGGGTITSQDAYGTSDIVGAGFQNKGAIGVLNNSGLISGANSALALDAGSTLGTLANSGTIAGNIFNQSGSALTIEGGSGASFGTLTGYSGGLGVADMGTIYSTSNLTFGSGNQLLNDNVTFTGGAGTATNAGTLQANNPLTITGNYVQNTGAKLILGVSNPTFNGNLTDTGYGRLIVSGNATLAAGSSVSLKSLGYSFAQGQRYVVLAAGGTITATGVNYTATGYNVTGTIQTDSASNGYQDLVLTLAGGGSSTPVNNATNGNANASLGGLFKYSGTDAALLALFNPAAALNNPDSANQAGEKLGPSSVKGAAADAQGAVGQAVGNVVNERMDGQRIAQGGQSGNSGVATGEAVRDIALWGQVFGGGATQGLRDNVSGYHANYRGVLIGADGLAGDQLRAGALVSFAKTSISNDGNMSGSSADINNYGLTAYASYNGTPWYVNVQAGVARQQYSTTRVVSFTGFNGVANGSFNGQQYSTSVQAGYPLSLDVWLPGTTLTPIAGLSYSSLRQNAYTETGGNGAALVTGSSTSNSLKSELAARLERSFDTSYGKVLPSLQLGWRHEYKGGATQTGASFVADSTGSTAFVTTGAAPIANLGVLNLGVTLFKNQQLSLTAKYTLEAGGGYTAQTGSMQVRWQY